MKMNIHRRGEIGTPSFSLEQAIQEITAQFTGVTWELKLEFFFDHLEIKKIDFLSYCYKHQIGDFAIHEAAHNLISIEYTDILVEFLQKNGWDNAPNIFFLSGYYLNTYQKIEWLELFQSCSQQELQNHVINHDLMETALLGSETFQEAAYFYYKSTFSIDHFFKKAETIYFKKNGIEKRTWCQYILESFIYSQFRHINFLEDVLFHSFLPKLRNEFHPQKKYYSKTTDSSPSPLSQRDIQKAFNTLGLSVYKKLPSRTTLRKRYCKMVKNCHPDLHSKNAHNVQKIIIAYNTCLTAYNK